MLPLYHLGLREPVTQVTLTETRLAAVGALETVTIDVGYIRKSSEHPKVPAKVMLRKQVPS
jgi:hypothetical protein